MKKKEVKWWCDICHEQKDESEIAVEGSAVYGNYCFDCEKTLNDKNELTSLASQFIKYRNTHNGDGKSFDDFFDVVGVPEENRTDFTIADILKQVREIEQ